MDSAKIKTGISAAGILALVFTLLGGIFCAIAAGFALNLPAVQARATGNAALFPIVFGAVGGPFLAVGLGFGCFVLHRRAVVRRVVQQGHSVMARAVGIRPDLNIRVNGRCPNVLECHWQDPSTGVLHVFQSRCLFFCPSELLDRPVRVYVDPGNMNRYYVDVDALLPDVRLH